MLGHFTPGGDRKQIAETGYCLGVAHERNGDPETALVVRFDL